MDSWYNKKNGGKGMYKLIACDLDETLLNDDKEICERNRYAIKKAEQIYGVKFVPATGRGYTCIDYVLHTLDTYDKKGEYIISNNGGIICENKGFHELTFHFLPFPIAKKVFAYGIQQNICMQVFTARDVYAYHLNEDEKNWLFTFKADSIIAKEDTIDFLYDTPIAKILFQSLDMEHLHHLADALKDIVCDEVSVSFSSNRYLEINHSGIDKGVGLRELAAHLGIAMADTMAIGDNYNDVAMLQAAGLSIAMSNAPHEIKQMCDYVTQADNNDGGVAEAIETFIFKNSQKRDRHH